MFAKKNQPSPGGRSAPLATAAMAAGLLPFGSEADAEDRRLFTAWAILVGLTALSVGVALAGREGASAVVMAASFVKARQVLDHFLDLRRAGSGWRGFFTAALVGLLSGIVVIGLV